MFSKFILEISSPTVFDKYMRIGEEIVRKNKNDSSSCLEKVTSEKDVINGSELQNSWFSDNIEADIFLSHSHSDKKLAIALSGWLKEEFNLNMFIDSCVWGCSTDLLSTIDHKYCYSEKTETYNYHKRNHSTAHVHMMLSIALSQMIDKTECVLFLNTPNSITLKDNVRKCTSSPWIYHELAMTEIIKQQTLKRYSQLLKRDHKRLYESAQNKLEIQYDVTKAISKFNKLTDCGLKKWVASYSSRTDSTHPLDLLYIEKGILMK